MKIQVQSLHFDADIKLIDFIEKKLKKLELFHDRIVDAEVFLKLEHPMGKIQEKLVEIKLNVPGATLVAKEKGTAFEEAIDLAAEAVRKQLIKHKEKQREIQL